MAAAKAMLDETHDRLAQPRSDNNAYTLGRLYGHDIVIACLPIGVYGVASAARALAEMLSTFPSLRFGLMVGVGGGVPGEADIRLGDVVVSKPTEHGSGVIPYDYGKILHGGRIQCTGFLDKPPPVLLTAISQLESDHLIRKQQIKQSIGDILDKNKEIKDQFCRPQNDWLFCETYLHENNARDCSACDLKQLIPRPPRITDEPSVHYGLVGSGNQVIKDARARDRIAQELKILCFEMEAAGLMDQLPCLVIRGICDYCDSHKNKEWQGHAALTAAAYARLLLSVTPFTYNKNNITQGTGEDFLDQKQTKYQGKLEESTNNLPAIDSINRQISFYDTSRSPTETSVSNVVEECGESRIQLSQNHVEPIQHNGTEIHSVRTLKGHSGLVISVAFSPDGKILVSGSLDKTVRLWNAVTGAQIRTLSGHSDRVDIIVFSPDGRLLASGSRDKTVRLWSVVTGTLISELSGNSDCVDVLFFSPDGRLLAFGSRNKMVKLWDTATRKIVGKFNSQLSSLTTLAFSPNGKVVASGTGDGKLRLWNNTTGVFQEMKDILVQKAESMVLSPDGSVLACEVGREIILWDITTCTVRSKLNGHSRKINTIVFSPDGHRIASGSHDKTVRLWDAATGATISILSNHSDRVNAVIFSPDGNLMVSGSDDKTMRLYRVSTGLTCAFRGYWGKNKYSVAFSPDGKVIAYPRATYVIIQNAVIEG